MKSIIVGRTPARRLAPIIFALLLHGTMAVRIPLSFDTFTPFLHHSMSGKDGNTFSHVSLSTFSWSNNFLGKLLHQASKVEIGPRGVRFIRQNERSQYNILEGEPSSSSMISGQNMMEWLEKSTGCLPSDLALCQVQTKEGWFFPSEGKWPSPPEFFITANNSLIKDPAMRLFAGETACHGENHGPGRIYHIPQAAGEVEPLQQANVLRAANASANASSRSDVMSVVYPTNVYPANDSTVYSVTSCDVLQGRLLVLYAKREETIFIYSQTFGPIAYFLILLSATISVGAIGSLTNETARESQPSNPPTITVLVETHQAATDPSLKMSKVYQRYSRIVFDVNATTSLLVCPAIYIRNKFHFHTFEDFLVFWFAVGSGLMYSLLSNFALKNSADSRIKRSMQVDACMYSLQTIAIAVYRTPENPYATILVFFMACRIWNKFFMTCHGLPIAHAEPWYAGYLTFIDLTLSLLNFNLLCEIGLKEQYILADIWPYYLTLILFLSYALIKYQWMMTIIIF